MLLRDLLVFFVNPSSASIDGYGPHKVVNNSRTLVSTVISRLFCIVFRDARITDGEMDSATGNFVDGHTPF